MIGDARPETFGGLRVVVVKDRPRYTLPAELLPGVPWPAAFKAEIDAWAAGFFAPLSDVADGMAYRQGSTVYMNVRTYAAMKADMFTPR